MGSARTHRIGRAVDTVVSALRAKVKGYVSGGGHANVACEPLEQRLLFSAKHYRFGDPYYCGPWYHDGQCDCPTSQVPNSLNTSDNVLRMGHLSSMSSPQSTSSAPVVYADGMPVITNTDLSSDGFGKTWGVTRSWSEMITDGPLGPGWMMTQLPSLVDMGSSSVDPLHNAMANLGATDTIAVVLSGVDWEWFDNIGSGGAYVQRKSGLDQLKASGGSYILYDTSGGQTQFYNFSTPGNALDGMFQSYTDPYGNVTTANYDTGGSSPTYHLLNVTRSNGPAIEKWVFSYNSVATPDQVTSVALQRSFDGTTFTTAQTVSYTYYDGSTSGGPANYLRTVTVTDQNGNPISISAYRYYLSGDTNGNLGDLKLVFDPDGYARAQGAGYDPTTATDAQVQPYASNYFKYGTGLDFNKNRVIYEVAQGAGCSCTGVNGQGPFTYSYTLAPGAYANGSTLPSYDAWAIRTTVGLPNGTQEVVYSNTYDQTMLDLTQELQPAVSISGITYSGTTATVTTSTAHGYSKGDTVVISGADQQPYDGTFVVAGVSDSTHFTYTMASSPGSAASGSIVAKKMTRQWGNYYQYGDVDSGDASDKVPGRLVMAADPSAVELPLNFTAIGPAGTSLDQAYPDLMGFDPTTGIARYLSTDSGLIQDYSWYSDISQSSIGWQFDGGGGAGDPRGGYPGSPGGYSEFLTLVGGSDIRSLVYVCTDPWTFSMAFASPNLGSAELAVYFDGALEGDSTATNGGTATVSFSVSPPPDTWHTLTIVEVSTAYAYIVSMGVSGAGNTIPGVGAPVLGPVHRILDPGGSGATDTAPGGVAGYLHAVFEQQGQFGVPHEQETWDYISHAAGDGQVNVVADDTVFRNSNGSGGENTSYAYTWQGTDAPATVSITDPPITNSENGQGGLTGSGTSTGTTTSIVDSSLTGNDDAYLGDTITITGGPDLGKTATVEGYTASLHTLALWPPLTTVTGTATTYSLTSPIVLGGGTVSGGTSTTLTDTTLGHTNGYYNGYELRIKSGTGAGETALVTGYVASTGVLTFSPPLATAPDSTSVYTLSYGSGVTTLYYDKFGRVTQITDPDGYAQTDTYDDGTGAMTRSVVDPGTTPHLNLTTTVVPDLLGRPHEVIDPKGHVTVYTYNDPNHEVRTYSGLAAGTANAAGSSSTLIDTTRSETDGTFVGYTIRITGGAGANNGSTATITGYTASTHTLTFSPSFSAPTASGWQYVLVGIAEPIQIAREYRGGTVYYETLTERPATGVSIALGSDGLPNGTEAIGTIYSLERQILNNGDQVVEDDRYPNLTDVTYTQSTTRLGTQAFARNDLIDQGNWLTNASGSWVNVFGGEGYDVPGDSATHWPSYLTAPTMPSTATWTGTTDARLPYLTGGSSRSLTYWTSGAGAGANFTIDVNITDGKTHQVGLYMVDWNNLGRSQRVDVINPSTSAVLDTATISSFSQGQWLNLSLSGHVQLKFTNLGASSLDAILNGIFFDHAGNFYATSFWYDEAGNLARTLDPTDTITRTVYDALQRPISTWVGTSDITGNANWWSPTNQGSANLVKTEDDYYDQQQAAPTSVTIGQTSSAGAAQAGTYYVRVSYVTGDGESLASSETTQTVTANELLNVSASSINGAVGYNVYVSEQLSAPSFPGTVFNNSTSGSGTLIAGTYKYEVTALSANGETTVSSEQSDSLVSGNEIQFNWNAVPGAVAYKVYRTAVNGGSGTELLLAVVQGGLTTSYTDLGTITPAGSPPSTNTTGPGDEMLQNSTPVAFGGSGWTEATSGLGMNGASFSQSAPPPIIDQVGDSNLTQVTNHPGGGAADRVTQMIYNGLDRLVAVKEGVQSSESTSVHRPIYYYTTDNLDELTGVYQYDGDGLPLSDFASGQASLTSSDTQRLRAQTIYSYDDLGQQYRQQTYEVNQTNGNIPTINIPILTTNTFYDHRGDVVAVAEPGGLFYKSQYDAAGRDIKDSTTDGGVILVGMTNALTFANASTLANDIVLEQTLYAYDAADNVTLVTNRQRFDNDPATSSGEGDLAGPSGGNLASRDYYTANWYDLSDRLASSVAVGTNNGSAFTYSAAMPSRSDTALRTDYAYDAAGNEYLTTDPRNIQTFSAFDLLGRATQTINAYTGSAPSNAADQTTNYTYDGDDNVLTMTAVMPSGTASQTTAYIYGVGGGNNNVFSNDLLAAVRYPTLSGSNAGNPNTAASGSESYAYDALGERTYYTDRNGSTHNYQFDVLGRLTADIVTTLGSGVNGTVRRLGYSYDTGGRPFQQTSYSDTGGTTVLNQVQDAYNGFGQLTAEYQAHTGTVSTGSTPAVRYYYTETNNGKENDSRQTGMQYPNAAGTAIGRVLDYAYGLQEPISQISASGTTATATYVGTNEFTSGDTIVISGAAAPQLDGTFVITGIDPTHSTFTFTFGGGYSGIDSSADINALKPSASPTFGPQDTLDNVISRVSGLQDHAGTSGGYSASNTIDETYTYLGLSNIVQKVRGNGVMLTYLKQSGDSSPASTTAPGGDSRYTLDAFGRVTDQAWITAGGINTPYDRAQYGYDRDSNILYKRVVDPVNTSGPGFSELYHANGSSNGYDNLNRLKEFTRGTLNSTNDSVTGTAARDQTWTLDAQGNWTTLQTTVNGGTPSSQGETFNGQNQITSISGLVTPTYDNNGNTTKDQNGNNYSYDAWNRLVALGGTNEVFAYDADGRRPAVTVCATAITDTYYSMDWQVLEEDSRPSCGGPQVQNQYVWSLSYIDDLVLRDDNSTNGSLGKASSGLGRRIYVEQDVNHNVTSLTDTSGTPVLLERFVYDPYGNFTVLSSTWAAATETKSWVYYFQGGRYDSRTGLYNFRFRDYNPTLGRWMEQDPAGYVDGANVYQFDDSEPSGVTDPFGLAPDPNWGIDTSPDAVNYIIGTYDLNQDEILALLAAMRDETWNRAMWHYDVANGKNGRVDDQGRDASYHDAAYKYWRDQSKNWDRDYNNQKGVRNFQRDFSPHFESGVRPADKIPRNDGNGTLADDVECQGDQHHAISRKVAKELENNPNLRGKYKPRDPRFVTRARTKLDHNGYERWHRDLDKEVTDWLQANKKATPEQFENFLRDRYGQPDLQQKFPNGLPPQESQ